jgi:hypothetical protein
LPDKVIGDVEGFMLPSALISISNGNWASADFIKNAPTMAEKSRDEMSASISAVFLTSAPCRLMRIVR